MAPITCTSVHDFNDNHIFQCEVYGINMNKIISFNTISELMQYPYFDDIGYLNLFACKFSEYDKNINFKYPKKLKILKYYYDEYNDINYPIPPDSLIHLHITGYGLPKLPEKLKVLMCNRCNIREIPYLPENLEELSCNLNKLNKIPPLPKTMKILACNNCTLTELPELPKSMLALECSNNKLKKLPEIPSTMISIYCDNNKIEKLPLSLEKCTMNVNYYDIDSPGVAKYRRNDKYEYFIFHNNPVKNFIWNNYNEKKKRKDIIKGKKMSITNRITWYFERLRAVKKIETEYLKRRYDPKYGFCKYMVLKIMDEIYEDENKCIIYKKQKIEDKMIET